MPRVRESPHSERCPLRRLSPSNDGQSIHKKVPRSSRKVNLRFPSAEHALLQSTRGTCRRFPSIPRESLSDRNAAFLPDFLTPNPAKGGQRFPPMNTGETKCFRISGRPHFSKNAANSPDVFCTESWQMWATILPNRHKWKCSFPKLSRRICLRKMRQIRRMLLEHQPCRFECSARPLKVVQIWSFPDFTSTIA